MGRRRETGREKTMSADEPIPLLQRSSRPLWSTGVTLDPSKVKLRQRSKITEIRAALVEAGYKALDDQAATLGLSRSTAWSILNPNHKHSGLSARTISRI